MKWLCLVFCSSLMAQEIDLRGAGAPISANGVWKWHEGDNPAWAAPDFDDSAWPTVKVPGSALPRQSGRLWLRFRVSVPAGEKITLGTAPLAEAQELYWNGVKVGALGFPGFDLFPRSVMASAIVPADGHAVIALRLDRPRGHAFYAMQLGEYSVFAGSEPAVGAWIDSRYRFPRIPLYVFFGPELPEWFSIMFAFSGLLVALYFLVAWYSAPEILGFLWYGINGLLAAAAIAFFAYWVDHEVSLAMGNRVLSLLWAGANIALLELFLVLARDWRWWPRILLYVPCFLGLAWELAFPDRSLPAETTIYLSTVALPALGLGTVHRNYREPFGRLLAFAMVPYTLVTSLASMNSVRQMLGYRFDHPLLALERAYDPAFQTSIGAMLAVVLGLYFQKSLERMRGEGLRMGQELAAGKEMQSLLLPPLGRAYAGFAVEAVYQPASEVGGDFYQIFERDGGLLAVVGDVSGKGLKAAMLVSVAIGILRATKSSSPGAILATLNEGLLGHTGGGFVTCCCARFDGSGTVTIANAGHPAPYGDGREIEIQAGLPLGVAEGVRYEESTATGMTFTFVSDGVVEAENPQRELFGFDRTREISGKSAGEIADAAKAWGQNDDITVVTVRRNG